MTPRSGRRAAVAEEQVKVEANATAYVAANHTKWFRGQELGIVVRQSNQAIASTWPSCPRRSDTRLPTVP